jgi:redox-sensitive bicupin YhaK (pirin superfamily)
MTAGRGVIHSEMPLQQEGRMRGFQLWLNLPAKEKLKPAWYADIPPERIASVQLPQGGVVKVIAGSVKLGDATVQGPIHTPAHPVTTEPLYVDVHLPANARLSLPVPVAHTALVYAYEGQVSVGDRALPRQAAGVLGDEGDRVDVVAGAEGARFLVLAGKALREPIVQYGPFVMNTRDEIETAIRDYQEGTLTATA